MYSQRNSCFHIMRPKPPKINSIQTRISYKGTRVWKSLQSQGIEMAGLWLAKYHIFQARLRYCQPDQPTGRSHFPTLKNGRHSAARRYRRESTGPAHGGRHLFPGSVTVTASPVAFRTISVLPGGLGVAAATAAAGGAGAAEAGEARCAAMARFRASSGIDNAT
jgi:hypothetical protein